MNHRPVPRPADAVRIVVEDVPDLDERIRAVARRAHETHRSVELVEPVVAACDHEARARMIRRMDEALALARRTAPGIDVRVGVPIELPRPRGTP